MIDQATDIHVTTNDGKDHPAKLIGADAKTDLALLKIDQRNQAFPRSPSAPDGARAWRLGVGLSAIPSVLAERSPPALSLPAAATSMKVRSIDSLQIDASINQGNSGGPTFDMAGT